MSNITDEEPNTKKLKLESNGENGKNHHNGNSVEDGSQFLTTRIPELSKFSQKFDSYASLYKFSIEHADEFWSVIARSRIEWMREFTSVCNTSSFPTGDAASSFKLEWFADGQLNVSVNCVDRHYKRTPNKIALINDQDEPGKETTATYEELYKLMNQVANMLREHGVKKGDRVAIYMPSCITTVAVMLACARIGAIHSVVFAGFSAEALASRINDSECSVVFTANQTHRAGKVIELKRTVDAAIAKCTCVKHVFVMRKTDAEIKLANENQKILEDELTKYDTECEPEVMNAEDPLFMLYTSGSTGKPKAIVHTQAGYLTQVTFTLQTVFDYHPDDIFGCLADVGWITGHSYVVYGPLSNGGTSVLFESSPIYPNPGRYWETVERLKINQLYIAPTSLRLLIKYGEEWVKKYDKSSLKWLGSVGEILNTEAWHFYHKVVGEERCKISDTWWQTETGAHCITPFPNQIDAKMKPGMAMRPFFGIEPVILDDKAKEMEDMKPHEEGSLCIKQPWPSMARTIYGDHERFLTTYMRPFPGYYYTGDGSSRDSDGDYHISGRIDDVMNVSGHRIGTAEVEDALDDHPAVAESAVVSYPHDIYGEGIYAYIILKDSVEVSEKEVVEQLKALVKSKIVAYAVPNQFLFTTNLPKTRSGKIMRRILRKIASDKPDELGDISTLADPTVVEDILNRHNRQREAQTTA